jgi:hypothetical protein
MLLDWRHLHQKCRDLASRICPGREAKRRFLRRLWRGDVSAAVGLLERYRPQARNVAVLEELIGYLRARQEWVPDYRRRRRACHYIGSGQVEKVNDLLVARRQKGRGMQWGQETSDALAALKTLVLNGAWDRYWCERQVLPLIQAEAA